MGFDWKANAMVLMGGGCHGFTREAMGLMGRFGFYRFVIGFYKFY